MIRTILLSLCSLVLLLGTAAADRRVAARVSRLADDADALARSADRSDDKEIRRTFATSAADLSDDLAALARSARKDADTDRLARSADKLTRNAGKLVDIADEASDRRERKTFRAKAERLERQLSDLSRSLEAKAEDDAGDGDRDRDRRPAPPKPTAMTAASFKAFVGAVSKESFDNSKIGVVSSAAQGNFFLASQVAAVMDQFTFGAGKIDAAATMWPRVLDPQNSFVLHDKLTFSSDKDRLRQRIGR